MKPYTDDELLMLSGIQHFCFCERQWALIHIEQQWAENVRTVEGHYLHERVDDPFFDESRGGRRIVRSMPLISRTLGLHGIADVVEFHKISSGSDAGGVKLEGRDGRWQPMPVEYKRGKPKPDERDKVQLCAQAICLEEMLSTTVQEGSIYYAGTQRREKVFFDAELREMVFDLSKRMHEMFVQGKTPPAVKGKHCRLCSLIEICRPDVSFKRHSVSKYIAEMLRYAQDTSPK